MKSGPAIVKRRAANGSAAAVKVGRAREASASKKEAGKNVPKAQKTDGPPGTMVPKVEGNQSSLKNERVRKGKSAVAAPKVADAVGTAGDMSGAPGKMKRRKATVPKAESVADGAKRHSSSATAADAGTALVPEVNDSAPEESRGGGQRVACTLFVGQLPYHATAADIESHFLTACQPPVRVRLLTHKGGGGSRGMAFVELGSESEVHSALRLHHSCIYGRRINVERTVGGGNMGPERERKLKELRSIQGAQMVRAVRELVHSVLPSAAEAEMASAVTRDDVDERALEFLSTVAPPVAEAALGEIAKLDLDGVRNRSAYLMGVLKRNVEESDPFAVPKDEGGGDRGRGKGGGKGGGKGKGGGGGRHGGRGRGCADGSKAGQRGGHRAHEKLATSAKGANTKTDSDHLEHTVPGEGEGNSTYAAKRRARTAGAPLDGHMPKKKSKTGKAPSSSKAGTTPDLKAARGREDVDVDL